MLKPSWGWSFTLSKVTDKVRGGSKGLSHPQVKNPDGRCLGRAKGKEYETKLRVVKHEVTSKGQRNLRHQSQRQEAHHG